MGNCCAKPKPKQSNTLLPSPRADPAPTSSMPPTDKIVVVCSFLFCLYLLLFYVFVYLFNLLQCLPTGMGGTPDKPSRGRPYISDNGCGLTPTINLNSCM
jgi:hypothetical protein